MSIELMTRVRKVAGLPTSAKYVLDILANYANEDGHAWPAVATVARDASMSGRSVQRYLRLFEEHGVIECIEERQKHRRTRVYKLHIARAERVYKEAGAFEALTKGGEGEDVTVGEEAEADPDTGVGVTCVSPTPDDAEGRHPLRPTPTPASPNPQEPQEPHARAREGSADGPPSTTRGEENGAAPINAAWKAAEPALREAIGEAAFESWLSARAFVWPVACDETALVLAFPGSYSRDHCAREYRDTIKRVLGREVKLVVGERNRQAQGAKRAELGAAALPGKRKRRRGRY